MNGTGLYENDDERSAHEDYRVDRAQQRAAIAREERIPDMRDERDLTCSCGVRSPHPNCPVCGHRLRAPGSEIELSWMRRHGYPPLAVDVRRLEPVGHLDV